MNPTKDHFHMEILRHIANCPGFPGWALVRILKENPMVIESALKTLVDDEYLKATVRSIDGYFTITAAGRELLHRS